MFDKVIQHTSESRCQWFETSGEDYQSQFMAQLLFFVKSLSEFLK